MSKRQANRPGRKLNYGLSKKEASRFNTSTSRGTRDAQHGSTWNPSQGEEGAIRGDFVKKWDSRGVESLFEEEDPIAMWVKGQGQEGRSIVRVK